MSGVRFSAGAPKKQEYPRGIPAFFMFLARMTPSFAQQTGSSQHCGTVSLCETTHYPKNEKSSLPQILRRSTLAVFLLFSCSLPERLRRLQSKRGVRNIAAQFRCAKQHTILKTKNLPCRKFSAGIPSRYSCFFGVPCQNGSVVCIANGDDEFSSKTRNEINPLMRIFEMTYRS